jgi:hypothetical protein
MKAPTVEGKHSLKAAMARIVYGFFGGFIAVVALLAVLNSSGTLLLTGNAAQYLGGIYLYVQTNLGASLYLFAAVTMGYVHALSKLYHLLGEESPEVDVVVSTEERVDLAVSLFFGIGVLWTAIGMRDALVTALGDMDATAAAAQGAWEILRRLVDGGILIALTTTIIGGFGGFAMRLFKVFLVGSRMKRFYENEAKDYEDEVVYRLTRIADLLESNQAGVAGNKSHVVDGAVE